MNYQPQFKIVDEYIPRTVRRGNWAVRRDRVTVEKGQVLPMGAILGKRRENGKCVLCARFAEDGIEIDDGSEVPYCILQIDVDASETDISAPIFRTGAFLGLDLSIGKGHTIEALEDDLALRGIYIEKGED